MFSFEPHDLCKKLFMLSSRSNKQIRKRGTQERRTMHRTFAREFHFIHPAIVLRVFFMFSASLLSLMICVKTCLCLPVAAIRKLSGQERRKMHRWK